MVFPEVVETPVTIKFCVKPGYRSNVMLNLLQRGGDALEMKKVLGLSGIHCLSKDKKKEVSRWP